MILPLRVIDQPGGPVIRCLCGAEAAVARLAPANQVMTGLRSSGPRIPRIRPDLSPYAVLAMVVHAKRCERAADVLAAVTEQASAGTSGGGKENHAQVH